MTASPWGDIPNDSAWEAIDDGPSVATRDERARDIALFLYDTTINNQAEAERLAHRILNITYPEVSTADQIEALPNGTILIDTCGQLERRELAGSTSRQGEFIVGTDKVWQTLGVWRSGKGKRRSSADLAVCGPWTVIHRVHA